MNLFYQPALAEGVHYLDPEESRHAIKVLRLQAGDELLVTDGRGLLHTTVITHADSKKSSFSIQKTHLMPARKFSVSLAIAPTKNSDRTEWFVEKAVELGIENIHFMVCKNSERKSINLDRIQKIIISAMKQSGQCWLPACHEIKPFQETVSLAADQKFICYVDSQNPDHLKSQALSGKSYLVLIGPEGDFREDELALASQNGFVKVSLGHNRLRTETAALAACHTLNLVNL